MRIQHCTVIILSAALVMAFCCPPRMPGQTAGPAQTQNQNPATQNQSSNGAQSAQAPSAPTEAPNAQPVPQTPANQPQATQKSPGSITVNPSQPPLQPVTTYPDAAGEEQAAQPGASASQNNGAPEAPQPKAQQRQPPQTEPQGAATAEKVPTAGGAAAKPAGVAIAPAKQHQVRSLLIKFGAVAAGAVAAGTVYALSRGTPSVPPGANAPGAVRK